MTLDDLFFKPSLELDTFQYSIFLRYATESELENDLLYKNTYWEIVKNFDGYQKEFNIWFDGSVGIIQPPPEPPPEVEVYNYEYEFDPYCTRNLW